MLLEWDEGMRVGVDLIDEEHKKLFAFLNALNDSIERKTDPESMGKTLSGLLAYTVYHFDHEERLFLKTDYPHKTEHVAEHKKITARLMEIYSKLRFGQTREVSIELMEFLKAWLIEHIHGMDLGYVPYVHADGAEG